MFHGHNLGMSTNSVRSGTVHGLDLSVSANYPCPRSVLAHSHGHTQARYRGIAELLTKHCVATSKTAIAVFCHDVVGEIVRPHRRPARKRPPASVQANGENTASDSTPASGISASAQLSTNPEVA